ncbi:MAG: DUF6265 family protein [Stenotrophomonas sp.]
MARRSAMTGLQIKRTGADAPDRIEFSAAARGTGRSAGAALYKRHILRMEAAMSIRPALSLLPLLCVAASTHPVGPPQPIEHLAWLTGCWQLDGQPAGAGEQRSSLAGGTMLGSSRSLRDGRTVGFEFMKLRQHDDGRLVFTALPSGRDATDFTTTHIDGNEAVFENPRNDFPQRISYRRIDDQQLHARISIARDNPSQATDFPMHRIPCGVTTAK